MWGGGAGIRKYRIFSGLDNVQTSYKDVEELEDSFMSEDVEDVPRDGVDDRQPMDLILQQGVDGIKQTEKTKLDELHWTLISGSENI